MIAAEIREDEYRIASSVTAFGVPEGEYGPLPCGCCIVAEMFDPVGPLLVLIMTRRDAECVGHSLAEFEAMWHG